MIFAWLVLVVVGATLLCSRAAANGYLVVLHSRRYGLILLERGADERYHLFAPHMLPFVLGRFVTLYVAFSLLLLHRRLHTSGQPRKAVPLTAKA